MSIVHTSDFAHLETHKNHMEWCTDLKLSELMQNSGSEMPESFTCICDSK